MCSPFTNDLDVIISENVLINTSPEETGGLVKELIELNKKDQDLYTIQRGIMLVCPEAATMFESASDLLANYNVFLASQEFITSTSSSAIWDYRLRSNDVVLMTAEWCTDLVTRGFLDIAHLKHIVLHKAEAVLSEKNKLQGLLETMFSLSRDSEVFPTITAVTSYLDPHGTTEKMFKENTELMETLTKCKYLPIPQIALEFEDGLLWISNDVVGLLSRHFEIEMARGRFPSKNGKGFVPLHGSRRTFKRLLDIQANISNSIPFDDSERDELLMAAEQWNMDSIVDQIRKKSDERREILSEWSNLPAIPFRCPNGRLLIPKEFVLANTTSLFYKMVVDASTPRVENELWLDLDKDFVYMTYELARQKHSEMPSTKQGLEKLRQYSMQLLVPDVTKACDEKLATLLSEKRQANGQKGFSFKIGRKEYFVRRTAIENNKKLMELLGSSVEDATGTTVLPDDSILGVLLSQFTSERLPYPKSKEELENLLNLAKETSVLVVATHCQNVLDKLPSNPPLPSIPENIDDQACSVGWRTENRKRRQEVDTDDQPCIRRRAM